MKKYPLFCALAAGLAGASLSTAPSRATDKIPLLDADISLAIEQRLLADPGVRLPLVDVDAREGVVRLTGNVDNLLAKERAGRIARSVRGARAVINQIAVKPAPRAADEIRKDVEAALESHPATGNLDVTALVKDGVVTLSAFVGSPVERQLALAAVKGVRGVTAVDDRMQVVVQEQRPDREIAKDVRGALEHDVWMEDRRIEVEVKDGKVSLRGEVPSAAQRARASSLVWVAGTKTVDNSSLTVAPSMDDGMRSKPRLNPTAAEIRDILDEMFRRDPRIASFTIDIDVDGSLVTLSGIVGNLPAKRAAEQLARSVRGVSEVRSRLRTHLATPVAREDLAGAVAAALARDAYLTDENLSVHTGGLGMVTLSGEVDSQTLKQRAEDVASQVKGVVTLINRIEPRSPKRPAFEEGAEATLESAYNPFVPDPHVKPALTAAPDGQIRESIESELFWSPWVEADEINVFVENGVATLTGKVDSAHAMSAAIENAREGGAIGVRNNLHVR